MEDYSIYSKSSLREIFKNRRLAVKRKPARSKTIIQRLVSLQDFIQSSSILLYYSSPWEISTIELIKPPLYIDKDIYLPSSGSLKITAIDRNTRYIEVIPGIKEPESPSSELPPTVDIAVLPGLAFDRKGYRLGYGSGWYDKILEKVRAEIIVGLCFQEQLTERLPSESHDKPVDIIITDREALKIK